MQPLIACIPLLGITFGFRWLILFLSLILFSHKLHIHMAQNEKRDKRKSKHGKLSFPVLNFRQTVSLWVNKFYHFILYCSRGISCNYFATSKRKIVLHKLRCTVGRLYPCFHIWNSTIHK